MKTKQKIQRMKQMMLLICCLLPIFSSCSSDESSTANFTVRYQEHSPWTIDPAIVETILEYQDQQQLTPSTMPNLQTKISGIWLCRQPAKPSKTWKNTIITR